VGLHLCVLIHLYSSVEANASAAERPLIMLGAAASRPRLAEALSDFVRRVRIPFFNTQMGKGAVAGGSSLYMGTAALSKRDALNTEEGASNTSPSSFKRWTRSEIASGHYLMPTRQISLLN
jgi:Thiamine pyrophosphate enzyme, central domain